MQEIIKLVIYLVIVIMVNYILYRKLTKIDRAKPTMPSSGINAFLNYDFIIEVEYLGEKAENKRVLYVARNEPYNTLVEFINSRTYKDFKKNQLEEEKILGYKVATLNIRKRIASEYIKEVPAVMLNGKIEYTLKNIDDGQEYIEII